MEFQNNGCQTEIEHDETFAPADLVPSHPTLQSQEQWADQQLDYLTRELIDTMTDGWTKAFCAKRSYTPEEAARCVYGDGDNAPVLAKEVLRSAFHGDVIDFAASAR